MERSVLTGLISHKKNFVFIGEAGSGKTEIALNFAVELSRLGTRPVHLFDMDQTKPNLRARDAAQQLAQAGVRLHYHEQVLDLPSVATGVNECLADPEAFVLLDIGGGAYGSHMIGQFHQMLNREQTETFYIINPYRPWSQELGDLAETMRRVMGSARLRTFSLVANPNVGPATGVEEICRGMERLRTVLGGQTPPEPKFVCALEELCPALAQRTSLPLLPIRLYTLPSWMRDGGESHIPVQKE